MNNKKIMTIQLKDGTRFTASTDNWSKQNVLELSNALNANDVFHSFNAISTVTNGDLFVRNEDIKYIYVDDKELQFDDK